MSDEIKKYPRKGEEINKDTFRLRVFGGWLVGVRDDGSDSQVLFIPDPRGEWVLEDPK